jgi:hypothetical protein
MKKRDKKKRARKREVAIQAKVSAWVNGLPPVNDPPDEWLEEQRAKKTA